MNIEIPSNEVLGNACVTFKRHVEDRYAIDVSCGFLYESLFPFITITQSDDCWFTSLATILLGTEFLPLCSYETLLDDVSTLSAGLGLHLTLPMDISNPHGYPNRLLSDGYGAIEDKSVILNVCGDFAHSGSNSRRGYKIRKNLDKCLKADLRSQTALLTADNFYDYFPQENIDAWEKDWLCTSEKSVDEYEVDEILISLKWMWGLLHTAKDVFCALGIAYATRVYDSSGSVVFSSLWFKFGDWVSFCLIVNNTDKARKISTEFGKVMCVYQAIEHGFQFFKSMGVKFIDLGNLEEGGYSELKMSYKTHYKQSSPRFTSWSYKNEEEDDD